MPMSQLLFSFRGRINRAPFWLATLALIVLSVLLVVGATMIGGVVGFGLVLFLLYIPLLWVGLAIGAKRLHDRDKSAWWLLVFYVLPGFLQTFADYLEAGAIVLLLVGAALSIWGLVELGFLRGTRGPNRYGPDPLGAMP